MKKLMTAMVLCAFLMTVGMGCGGPSTPTKSGTGEKKAEDKKDAK